MKTKLLGVVAACMFALVGTARASTFQISGDFYSFSGTVYACAAGCITPYYQVPGFPIPYHLSGSLTFSNGALTGLDMHGFSLSFSNFTLADNQTITTVSFTNDQLWTVEINKLSSYTSDLLLTNHAGQLTASLYQQAQLGSLTFDGYIGTFGTFIGSAREVPLPAALPLFATGLGALGLLGWRRKKAQASGLN